MDKSNRKCHREVYNVEQVLEFIFIDNDYSNASSSSDSESDSDIDMSLNSINNK